MHLPFADLPKSEQTYLIDYFGLREDEAELLRLKYVMGFDYDRIAAEMHISRASVGALLTRTRKRVVKVARIMYPIAEPRCRHLVESLGWLELDWPVIHSRNHEDA